jgi:hypothetical protein
MKHIIKIIITLWLIYMSYKETGIFTAICLFLIFIAIELISIAGLQTLRIARNKK